MNIKCNLVAFLLMILTPQLGQAGENNTLIATCHTSGAKIQIYGAVRGTNIAPWKFVVTDNKSGKSASGTAQFAGVMTSGKRGNDQTLYAGTLDKAKDLSFAGDAEVMKTHGLIDRKFDGFFLSFNESNQTYSLDLDGYIPSVTRVAKYYSKCEVHPSVTLAFIQGLTQEMKALGEKAKSDLILINNNKNVPTKSSTGSNMPSSDQSAVKPD